MRVSGYKIGGVVYDAEQVLGVRLLVRGDAAVDPSQGAVHCLPRTRVSRDVTWGEAGSGGARWEQTATCCRTNDFITAYLFNSFTCRLATDHVVQSHDYVRSNLILHLNAAGSCGGRMRRAIRAARGKMRFETTFVQELAASYFRQSEI
jgi:hypothetical protein